MAQPEDRPSFHRTQASVWLDGMRAAAALMVLLLHWRFLLFCPLLAVRGHRLLYSVAYLLTAGGRTAVIVFFVLSGFLVGGSVLRAFERQPWGWLRYLTHRLVRLWLVLLPALALGMLWDAGRLLLARSQDARAVGAIDLSSLIPWKLALANAFFLQGQRFHVLGTNGSLWSLSYEFWYYLLFPLALCGLWPRADRLAIRALWLLGFAATLGFVATIIGVAALGLFPAWLAGAALHYAPRRRLAPWMKWTAVGAFACCFEGLVPFQQLHPYPVDMTIATATALLLWVLLCDQRPVREEAPGIRAVRGAAGFSYTLYLTHDPILFFLALWVRDDRSWYPDLPHTVEALGLLALIVAYSWVIGRATEAHTGSVRQWVERRLPRT